VLLLCCRLHYFTRVQAAPQKWRCKMTAGKVSNNVCVHSIPVLATILPVLATTLTFTTSQTAFAWPDQYRWRNPYPTCTLSHMALRHGMHEHRVLIGLHSSTQYKIIVVLLLSQTTFPDVPEGFYFEKILSRWI